MHQLGFCREWSSRPEDEQRLKKASSVDLSLPALGKQQIKAKAAFPWVTKLLVSALVVLFAVQVTNQCKSQPHPALHVAHCFNTFTAVSVCICCTCTMHAQTDSDRTLCRH